MSPSDENPTVYTTKDGDLRKRSPKTNINPTIPPHLQTVYLHKESKGRGGKTVSLVKNLQLSDDELKNLMKQLKQACGVGGTVKEGIIEIQGEQREKIATVLKRQGYKVKIAGG